MNDTDRLALYLVLAYVAPVIVALSRKHPQRLAISALAILGGWTVIGWIAALVWACTNTPQAAPAEVATTEATEGQQKVITTKTPAWPMAIAAAGAVVVFLVAYRLITGESL